MRSKPFNFSFTAQPWQYAGPGGWCFVSLPEEVSEKIRKQFKDDEEGWGRLKVMAKTGRTEWATAIWFDTKKNTYLLPLKAEVRKKEKIGPVDTIEIQLRLGIAR